MSDVVYSTDAEQGFTKGFTVREIQDSKNAKDKDKDKERKMKGKTQGSKVLSFINRLRPTAEEEMTEESAISETEASEAQQALREIFESHRQKIGEIVPRLVAVYGLDQTAREREQAHTMVLQKELDAIVNGLRLEVAGNDSKEEELLLEMTHLRELLMTEFLKVAVENVALKIGAIMAMAEDLSRRGILEKVSSSEGPTAKVRGQTFASPFRTSPFRDVRENARKAMASLAEKAEEAKQEGFRFFKEEVEKPFRQKSRLGLLEALKTGADLAEGCDPGDYVRDRNGDVQTHPDGAKKLTPKGYFHVRVEDGEVFPVDAVGRLGNFFAEWQAIGVRVPVSAISDPDWKPGKQEPASYGDRELTAGNVVGRHYRFLEVLRRAVKHAEDKARSAENAERERRPYRDRATTTFEKAVIGGKDGVVFIQRGGTWRATTANGEVSFKNPFSLVEFRTEEEEGGKTLFRVLPDGFPERFKDLFGPAKEETELASRDDFGPVPQPTRAFLNFLRNRMREEKEKREQEDARAAREAETGMKPGQSEAEAAWDKVHHGETANNDEEQTEEATSS